MLDLLTELLRLARSCARPRKFDRYEPTPYDAVNRLATYTANLATLRILVTDDKVSPQTLAPVGTDPILWWRSLVNLWESGLDTEGWQSILAAFTLSYGPEPHLIPMLPRFLGSRARLLQDHAEELQILAGEMFLLPDINIQSDTQKEHYLNFIQTRLGRLGDYSLARLSPATEERFEWITDALASGMLGGIDAGALWQTLSRAAPRLPFETVDRLVSLLLTSPDSEYGGRWTSPVDLATMVAAHPSLLLTNDGVTTIAKNPEFPIAIYDLPIAVVLLRQAEQTSQEPELSALRALRLKFDERAASNPKVLGSPFLAPEYLTYLRINQPAYWDINDKVLQQLSRSTSILRRTAPQDALYLATAHQGDSKDAVVEFVEKYLTAQGQPVDGLGENNAAWRLAAYAELPWSRP